MTNNDKWSRTKQNVTTRFFFFPYVNGFPILIHEGAVQGNIQHTSNKKKSLIGDNVVMTFQNHMGSLHNALHCFTACHNQIYTLKK